jgi:hypothetical protein
VEVLITAIPASVTYRFLRQITDGVTDGSTKG